MILKSPAKTEKSLRGIEKDNTMKFEVALAATRNTVKAEVEKVFSVKVAAVRTYIGPNGKKHAFVRFAKGVSADEIAAKLKMLT